MDTNGSDIKYFLNFTHLSRTKPSGLFWDNYLDICKVICTGYGLIARILHSIM